jgi:hypothetical protein
MPHVLQGEVLVSCKSKNPSRCADHNMRAFILQQVFMLSDVDTSVEDSNFYFGQVLAEPLKLVAYLHKKTVANNQKLNT